MSWHRTTVAIPLIPTALALAVRFHGLSDKPLWLDEIITQRRANLPISDLIANSLYNKQFPTYFVLIRAFDAPIINEWTLRLPSTILGAISVLLVALIATEVRSRRAGLVAGILMALSPLEVQFGQEARSYALVSCFVLLALWGLVRIAKQLSISVSPSSSPKGQLGSWAAYTIGTIGALNVLLVSAPWLVASNLAMAAIVRRSGPKRTELIRNWTLTQAIILLTWLPGLVAIYLAAHEDPLRSFRWLPPITFEHVWSVISAVYLFRASDIITFELLPTFVPGFGAAVVALVGVGCMASQSQSDVAERHRFRCDRNADNDSGRIDILRDLGSPILDLEHGSVLRAGGNRGGRSAAPTLSARCNGPCDWWDGESCAVLSIRNQAGLGISSRLSRCKCAAR